MFPEDQNHPSSEPLMASAVGRPTPAGPRRRSRPILILLLLLLILGLCGSLVLNMMLFGVASLTMLEGDQKISERYFSHEHRSSNKVAIITVNGLIAETDGFVKKQIDQAKKDDKVKAVVLRVDSPGGTIGASDYLFHRLGELREESDLPIVVSMGSLAASGGYYVAMACGDTPEAIFAEPTTWTGSIGVIIPHYNIVELMDRLGIQEDSIASGALKTMGSFTRTMTEQERKIFEGLVEEGFQQFKAAVKQGRPKFREDPKALDRIANGQIYTAQQAKDNGLVDRIGFLEDAVKRAIALADLSEGDVQVIRYKEEPRFVDAVLGAQARRKPLDLNALLETTCPRAYYLCTWLPPLTSRP